MNKHFMSAARKASAAVAVMVLCGMGTGVVNAATVTINKETSAHSNINLNHTGFYHVEGKHFVDNGCGYLNELSNGSITRKEASDINVAMYQNDVRLANTIGSFTATEENKDSDGVIQTAKQDGLKTEIFNSTSFQNSIIKDAKDADITGATGKYKYVSTTGTVVAAINGAYEVLDAAKANVNLDNLSDAGKAAVKGLAQDAVEVKGEGAAEVTSKTENGKTTYTLKVNGDGEVKADNKGLVTGETVYNALKNEIGTVNTDGTFADFAQNNLLSGEKTVNGAVNKLSNKMGAVNADGDTFTDFNDSDLAAETTVTGAISKVNGKVGATDADGKFTDFKGDNLLAGKTTASSAIAAVSGKMGATGADGKFSDFAGSDIADAESVTGAVKAVNDKVGDTQYASTKYVAAGTSATEAIGALDKGLSDLDGKIGKVGAGAAALAALHPLDYDADDKFSFAAGYGNYAGENAAALGAFYRPNENVMFSVGGTLGTGENMVNAGVSFALGHGAAAGTSKAAMAKKIEAQDEEIADLKAEVAELKAMVRELAAK